MTTYGFIGCGAMGGALVRAVAKTIDPACIRVSGRSAEKTRAFAQGVGVTFSTNAEIAQTCDYVVLGVKPQVLPAVCAELAPVLAARQAAGGASFVLVSMAAATSIAKVQDCAGGAYPVIRIMPNLAASVGQAMTLYCTDGLPAGALETFLADWAGTGSFAFVEEKLFDVGTGISGCGPAFVFMFIEALADGGVQCGLPRATAQLLAAKTLQGSAALLLESGQNPGALKDAVCSPGGTTIAGVHALEQGAFRATVAESVLATVRRSREMN